MLRKRTRNTLLIAFLLVVLLALAVFLRMKAPPESARLLPESDAVLYFDLKPLRATAHPTATPLDMDPDYQRFLANTGFNYERDLDELAIALHQMPDPNGPNGPIAYSIVLQGRFNRKKLEPYVAALSTSRETYVGHDIYTIPVEGRTLRVTFLGYDMVATSNMPTPEQIHSIVDRYRSAALPSSGSSLVAERYGDVPLLSIAWGIGRLGLPFAVHPPGKPTAAGQIQVMGFTLPIPADASFVASVGFDANIAAALSHSGAVHLRVDEITPDGSTAETTAQTLASLLNLYRGLQGNGIGVNSRDSAALQASLRSLNIEHHNNRVILTGTVSTDLVRGLFAPAQPDQISAPTPTPSH